ncbi:hypothetical protein ACQP2F_14995 [Actinoplanes sp. CA-030573]|uniref:hypothetical protein n=1 Tax=Actinoplanes sp. CA-030573 TaxID=3239898 RepID=UPI003D946983
MRQRDLPRAIQLLDGAAMLYPAIEASLPAMVDNLSTYDYHQIRETLYEQFGREIVGLEESESEAAEVARLRRHVADLRVLIFAWRDMHLHLPRNNLGGSGDKVANRIARRSPDGGQDAGHRSGRRPGAILAHARRRSGQRTPGRIPRRADILRSAAHVTYRRGHAGELP